MATARILASGVQAAIGGRYDAANDRLVFAAFYGYLSAVTLPTAQAPAQLQQLGSGYDRPEDVLLARKPGTTTDVLYLSDRNGTIYEVNPSNGYNRAQATALVSGLIAPHQMALSNDGGSLYVVEYRPAGSGPGRLLQVPLTGGVPYTVLLADVSGGVGIATGPPVSGSDQVYLVEQGTGTLTRVDVTSRTRAKILVTGLTAPFFLSWQDAARTRLLLPLRDPTDRVVQVDLAQLDGQGLPRVTRLLDGVPWRPSSAVVVAGEVVVFSDREIVAFNLASAPRATVPRGMGGGGAFFWPRIDPADPSALLMSSDMGGLYRSADGGASWSMLDGREVSGYRRFSAVFVPNSGGKILAAHKQRKLRLGTPTLSDPTGISWTDPVPQPPVSFEEFNASRPHAAAYSPDGGVLLLGMGTSGIYRWDFGATPAPMAWPAPFVPNRSGAPEDIISIEWADNSIVVAATEQSVYWSPDRGQGWYPLEPPSGSALPAAPNGKYDADTSRVLSLAVAKASGTVEVWVSTPRPNSAVYRCDLPPGMTSSSPLPAWQRIAGQADVAAAWPANTATTPLEARTTPPAAGSILFRRIAVASSAPDTVHVAVAYTDIPKAHWSVLSGTRSAGGGAYSWSGSFDGYQSPDQAVWRDLADPNVGWVEPDKPSGLGFGSGGAANGLTIDTTGHTLFYVNAMCAYTCDPTITPRVWRQRYTQPVLTARGQRWRTTGADDTTVWHYTVSPYGSQVHFLANTDIRLSRSDDAGDTWQLISLENTCYGLAFPGGSVVYAAVSSEHDLGHSSHWDKFPYGQGKGEVRISSDNGATWDPLPVGNQTWQTNPVTNIRIAPSGSSTPGVLHAAVFGSGVWIYDGTIWSQLTTTGLPQKPYVYQVDVDANGRLLCLVTRNSASDPPGAGLYRLEPTPGTNGIWKELSADVAQKYGSGLFHPVSFTCHPTDPDKVWLCTASVKGTNGPGQAFLRTVATGTAPVWTAQLTRAMIPPDGPIHLSVFSIAYDPADTSASTVYAATGTHGVFSSTNPTATPPTWTAMAGVPFLNTQRLAFDTSDPGTLYVTTAGGGAWRTMKPSHAGHWQQLIRRKAYELYRARNGGPDEPLADWLAAQGILLHEVIQYRAYELYERRGHRTGRALEDWLTAETEIIHILTS